MTAEPAFTICSDDLDGLQMLCEQCLASLEPPMFFRADVLQLAHSPDGFYEQSLDRLNQLAAEHLKAKHPGMSA